MRNEESYIEACLDSLLSQSYPLDLYEVIVVDGQSSDRSLEIVRNIQRQWPNVRCLDNPAGIVPAAMNIGIRNAQGDILIRADAHNIYPQDYIANCVKYLRETGAENVGGPWITIPADSGFSAKLVAGILSNPFGVGNSHFRTNFGEGFVDTVPFGAFRRDLFDRIGLYNERLVRNQDNDLNSRIREAGGRIYQTPALTTQYHPVKKFGQLLRKTFRESQWHIFTLRQNRNALALRHFVPALFVLALLVSLCFVAISRSALIGLASLLVVYLVAAIYYGNRVATRYGYVLTLAMPLCVLCFHVAYGMGTLVGLRYLFREPAPKPIRPGQEVQ